MGRIILKEMEFFAYHGCMEHEQKFGGTFLVDINLDFDTSKAETTDNLTKTIDYLEVYNIVKEQMNKPSKLLEHVAARIIDNIFENFMEIQFIELSLSKLQPPLGGKVERATVILCRKR